MSFNYTPLNTTAKNLIAKFGQSVTFSRFTRTGYTPNAGMSSTGSTYTASVALLNEPKVEDGESSVERVGHKALVSSTTEPKIGDTATINSEKLRIQEVLSVKPSTAVVYYELRLGS